MRGKELLHCGGREAQAIDNVLQCSLSHQLLPKNEWTTKEQVRLDTKHIKLSIIAEADLFPRTTHTSPPSSEKLRPSARRGRTWTPWLSRSLATRVPLPAGRCGYSEVSGSERRGAKMLQSVNIDGFQAALCGIDVETTWCTI